MKSLKAGQDRGVALFLVIVALLIVTAVAGGMIILSVPKLMSITPTGTNRHRSMLPRRGWRKCATACSVGTPIP